MLFLLARCTVILAFTDIAVAQSNALTAAELGGGEVQVAVNGQDEAERQAAYRVGLRTLLNRYARRADDPAIADSEAAQEALGAAENLVDAFEYARIADLAAAGSIPVTRTVRDSGEASHILTVQYSFAALDQLLAASNAEGQEQGESESDSDQNTNAAPASVARAAREALLWILVQDDGAEIMIGNETAPAVVGRVKELAGGVGWISGFPSLDVVDLAAVGPETLEQLDESSQVLLQEAARRYRFPRLLAGTVARQREGNWKLSLLSMDVVPESPDASAEPDGPAVQAVSTIELQAATLDASLQLVVAWMSGGLDANGATLSSSADAATTAATQSSFSTSADGARIWFAGVAGGADYARIADFLGNIEGITSARMVELRPDGLLFQINPRSALAVASAELQGQSWLQLSSRLPSQTGDTDTANGSLEGSSPDTASSTVAGNRAAQNESPQADLYLRYIR